MKSISYKCGYKYQLYETYSVQLDELKGRADVVTDYINFYSSGLLEIKKGYAWDGPSGPTIDTSDFMRGALIHDALYQMIREGYLKGESDRKIADQILRRVCLEDGMCFIRASYVYFAVRTFAKTAASSANIKRIYYAPELK